MMLSVGLFEYLSCASVKHILCQSADQQIIFEPVVSKFYMHVKNFLGSNYAMMFCLLTNHYPQDLRPASTRNNSALSRIS